jgi:hypothetical protein
MDLKIKRLTFLSIMTCLLWLSNAFAQNAIYNVVDFGEKQSAAFNSQKAIQKVIDDAICLKTTKQGPRSESCEDILITNYTGYSTSCLLKIGTELQSDFYRMAFTNCTIGIILRDGGTVSDVKFSNFTMDLKRKPFFWWENGETHYFNVFKSNPFSSLGKIENVTISNICGTVEGTSAIKGFAVETADNKTISNINIQDINLILRVEAEKNQRVTHVIELINKSDERVDNISIR